MVLLQGCVLPLPFQIASWGTQGISYVTTEKSITDNVISKVTKMDCDSFRMVTELVEYCFDIEQEEEEDIWIVINE